jgi:hypothetical protein
VTYNLTNIGGTSVNVYAQHMTLTDTISDDSDLPESPPYESGDKPVYFTIASGKHFFRTLKYQRADFNDLAKVRANERYLYLFGYIKYRDAFDEPHVLRMAVKYKPSLSDAAAITDRPGYNIDT